MSEDRGVPGRRFVDDDADLSLVQDRNVAVIGYDDLAAASARCLRDSGVDVRIGLEPDGPGAADAEAEGLRVVAPYEACEEADLIVVLTESVAGGFRAGVLANMVPGDVVVLGPGVDATPFTTDAAATGVDVVRVAAWAGGATLREEYSQGRGVAMFAAVVQDASGSAWDLALAYARAVGATRAGVLRVGEEEYRTARETADTLLGDEVLRLLRAGFDSLVASGCRPEVAYLTCIHGLAGFADQLGRGTLDAKMTAVRASDRAASTADPFGPAAGAVRSMIAWSSSADAGLH